ncbi:884_t:CDS:2, partial [Scutellospora calospora]
MSTSKDIEEELQKLKDLHKEIKEISTKSYVQDQVFKELSHIINFEGIKKAFNECCNNGNKINANDIYVYLEKKSNREYVFDIYQIFKNRQIISIDYNEFKHFVDKYYWIFWYDIFGDEYDDLYLLKPFKNDFKWGYLSYETEKNDIIYPRQTSVKIVQGRENSMSGVQGSFTFDVVRRSSNDEVAQIKLFFDIPYDTNVYSRATRFEIIKYTDNDIFKIETAEEWGGYGYSENKYKFTIVDIDVENPIIESKSLKSPVKKDKSKKNKYLVKEKSNCDTLNAHLSLLKIFKTLRHENDDINRLFLSEAEKRYNIWLNLLNDKFNNDDNVDIPVPPIDVCQIWHAHLLSPLKYFKDMKELYKQEYKFPLERIYKFQNENNIEYFKSVKFWEKYSNQPWILNIQNKLPFTSKLVDAVIRQYKFTDKIINYDINHLQAIEKYKKFLLLFKNNKKNLVPTIDINLCWHTHMLYATNYRNFTKKYTGKIINHDDKISKSILFDNFKQTSDIWYKNFNELYIHDNLNSRGWCDGGCILNPNQENELVNKFIRILEVEYKINGPKHPNNERTNGINHLKSYIRSPPYRQTFYNYLYYLRKFISLNNIQNVCNATLVRFDNDVNYYKTLNINAAA